MPRTKWRSLHKQIASAYSVVETWTLRHLIFGNYLIVGLRGHPSQCGALGVARLALLQVGASNGLACDVPMLSKSITPLQTKRSRAVALAKNGNTGYSIQSREEENGDANIVTRTHFWILRVLAMLTWVTQSSKRRDQWTSMMSLLPWAGRRKRECTRIGVRRPSVKSSEWIRIRSFTSRSCSKSLAC